MNMPMHWNDHYGLQYNSVAKCKEWRCMYSQHCTPFQLVLSTASVSITFTWGRILTPCWWSVQGSLRHWWDCVSSCDQCFQMTHSNADWEYFMYYMVTSYFEVLLNTAHWIVPIAIVLLRSIAYAKNSNNTVYHMVCSVVCVLGRHT